MNKFNPEIIKIEMRKKEYGIHFCLAENLTELEAMDLIARALKNIKTNNMDEWIFCMDFVRTWEKAREKIK